MGLFDLFKPAWKSNNVVKATNAVRKIFDEEKLKEIVLITTEKEIRGEAIKKITDEAFIKKLNFCVKCGNSKEYIRNEQRRDREKMEKAFAEGAGMMMFGMTPSSDFMKCPKCDKIACSGCASENCCPFCGEIYLQESVIIKSKSAFVQ